MGVPSFYRWLVNKYPKIVVNAVEAKPKGDDESVAIDTTSSKNPNGDFDNLYLDMNGIIHPCFHPEGDHPSPPLSFEDVFRTMFDYIDRLFGIVRPRKLLYMAIDGVAPRAKMNQQRSRRFRTAKDCQLAEAEEDMLRRQFELDRKHVFPKQESQLSDSNIITPGTEFMYELSKALQSYVDLRLKNDDGWKDIKVILSDANVPGEGEHKIMSFIRMQRSFPNYDPNTRHCIYGLDADLIMLVLATHEVHFSILREDIIVPEQPFYQCARKPYTTEVELSLLKTKNVFKCCKLKPYQFLHIWILREYLELDMKILDPPKYLEIDLERIIDDFIFICFFMGNDFLPHMPSLQIHEGAIDLLMHVYKEELKKFGGYFVDMQYVGDENMRYINLKRVETFILSVGQKEELIFKKRTVLRERKLRRLLSECSNAEEEDAGELPSYSTPSGTAALANKANSSALSTSEMLENTKELKERLNCWSRDRLDLFKDGSFLVDKVRYGASGWKQRYYKEKFCAETKEDAENTRRTLVQKYTEGLCWVLLYYFSGVPSWNWFYDYHYGPLASDLRGVSSVKVKFEIGVPFKPFDQLMGVLPPRSGHALPEVYWALMTSPDSKLQDFYPLDFDMDTDGRRFLWQGICKLPFIDEKRLTSETKKLEIELKDDELIRNSTKKDLLFFRSNELGAHILSDYKKQLQSKCEEISKEKIPTNLSCGINGSISPLDEDFTTLRLTGDDALKDPKDIEDDSVLCVQYQCLSNGHHVPRPLMHNFPDQTIYEVDIMETKLWHEHPGSRTSYRPSVWNYPSRTNEVGSDLKMSSKGPIHICAAGTGWSAGRGKGFSPNTERIEHGQGSSVLPIRFGQKTADLFSPNDYVRRGARGRGYRNPSSDISENRQNYRSSPADRGDYSGFSKKLSNRYGSAGRSNDNSWRQPNAAVGNPIQCRNFGSKNTNVVSGRGRASPDANATSAHWRVRGDSTPSVDDR